MVTIIKMPARSGKQLFVRSVDLSKQTFEQKLVVLSLDPLLTEK